MVAQAPLFGAIFGLLVVASALLSAIPRYLDVAEITSARESLSTADATDAAVQAQIRLAPDAAAQAASMAAVLAPLLADTAAQVYRTVQSPPVEVALPTAQTASMILGSDPEFEARTQLVAGSPGGAALQASAAEALGLAVGDTVLVGGTAIEITATWLPRDASDPYWFGDPAVVSGESSGSFGPLVLPENALAALDLNPFVRWTLVPDRETITTDQLGPLGEAASSWESAIRDDSALAAGGVIFAGGLAATVTTIERGITSVSGVSPIPLVLTGVIGFLALLQLARLLADVRSDETLLLRARGRPAWRAGVSGAAEAAVVALPAVSLGSAIAVLAVPQPAFDVLWPATLALLAVLGVAAVATSAARRAHMPGRAATGAAVSVLVLTVVAAGVSLWQFRLYGSPLVTSAAGEPIVDPIAVLAPCLALLACAVVAVAALPPVAAALAALASRDLGLARVLPTRQVARRATTFAVPLLLVCLAVGGATMASGYSATWTALTERAGELRNGSDVRVAIATSAIVGGAASIVSSAPFGELQATATPTLIAATEAGDDSVSLVALSAAELPAVMADLGGSLDRAAVAAAIDTDAQGILLPPDATRLTLTVSTTVTTVIEGAATVAGQGDTSFTAWVADSQGALARVPLERDEAGTVSADLPDGISPWSVLAIDSTVTTGPNAATYGVEIDAGAAGWQVQREAGTDIGEGTLGSYKDSLGFDLTIFEPGPAVLVRLMPPTPPVLPIAITDALAQRLGISAGDSLELRLAGSGLSVNGIVASTVPLLPGSTGSLGALADLRGLNEQVLRTSSSVPRPDQVWIATADPAATIAQLQLPTGARATTADSGSGIALQRPVVLALWWGGAGALVLAAAAIAAVAGAMARARHPEVASLRALGVDNRAQARSRAAELLLVVAIAIVLGVVAGVVVSLLTVGELARSAVLDAPTALPATLQFDVATLAMLLVAFSALVIGIAALYGARVRRQAAASTGREVGA